MDYNFSGLCGDQMEKLGKRLESLSKAFIKEYVVALNVINNERAIENKAEIVITLENVLHDKVEETKIGFARCLNEIQGHLHSWVS